MDDERRLLDEIVRAPDDDEPRRVYADWLMEQGEPLGEYVQLELSLEALRRREPEPTLLDEIERLSERSAQLAKKHLARHRRPLRALGATVVDMKRGLPYRVALDAAALLEHGDEILGGYPITHVAVKRLGKLAGELARSPLLPRIRVLELDACRLSPKRTLDFLQHADLSCTRELDLTGNQLDVASVQALVGVRAPQLQRVKLRSTRLGASVEVLTRWPLLSQLSSLDLSNADLAGDAIIPFLDQLPDDGPTVHLHDNPLGDRALEHWICSSGFRGLERLHIYRAEPTRAGAPLDEALTGSGLRALASSRHTQALSAISIYSHTLDNDVFAALSQVPRLPRLRYLSLEGWNAEGVSVEAMMDSELLGGLRGLELKSFRMGLDVRAFAGCARLTELERLNFSVSKIGDAGLRALLDADMPRLRYLGLAYADVGDEGMKALLASPLGAQLEVLDLQHRSRLSASTRQALEDEWEPNDEPLHGTSSGFRRRPASR